MDDTTNRALRPRSPYQRARDYVYWRRAGKFWLWAAAFFVAMYLLLQWYDASVCTPDCPTCVPMCQRGIWPG